MSDGGRCQRRKTDKVCLRHCGKYGAKRALLDKDTARKGYAVTADDGGGDGAHEAPDVHAALRVAYGLNGDVDVAEAKSR